jgi:hypothetical protein
LEKKRGVIGKLIQRTEMTEGTARLKELNDQLAKLGVF